MSLKNIYKLLWSPFTKQKFSKLVTSNSFKYTQNVDKISFDIGKKKQTNLFQDFSTPPIFWARQILEGQITRFFFLFFLFFPAYSLIAKISAHLRLSWLYLSYLTAKSISFLLEKLNPRKFSSLPTCGFLAQLVAAPSEYLGGMGSNPIQGWIFFSQLFSNW